MHQVPLPESPESPLPERVEFELSTLPVQPEQRLLLPAVLFLVTVLTTWVAGFFLHIQFVSNSGEEVMERLFRVAVQPADLVHGLPFAVTLLVILLAHEMGHYLACRYYRIWATLPYVIPAPPPIVPFGTFGAVIRIKSPFRDRRQLFDVGIAGPLAGFVFIVPAILIGVQSSRALPSPAGAGEMLIIGEPLLFQLALHLFYSGGGEAVALHPIGWAAWFGTLATSLNLLPIGQLDGGHVVYALFGPRAHRKVSYLAFAGLIGVGFLSWPLMGYLLFSMILLFIGFRHPAPSLDVHRLGSGRVLLSVVGLVVFALTFIPIPVQFAAGTGS